MEVLARLVSALSEAAGTLPGLLAKWESLELDLQEHYASELEWLLSSARAHLQETVESEVPTRDLMFQACLALQEICALGSAIESAMGFRPESILSPIELATSLDCHAAILVCRVGRSFGAEVFRDSPSPKHSLSVNANPLWTATIANDPTESAASPLRRAA